MKQFFAVMARRKTSAALTFLGVLGLGLLLTHLIPSVYESRATFLVERDETSTEEFGESFSGYADRRIQVMRKRVFTKANLSALSNRFELFGQESYLADGQLREKPLAELAKRFDLKLLKIKAADAKMRFQVESAIAFEVSYRDGEPARAQRVLEYIIETFETANREDGSLAKDAASGLLSREEADLKASLSASEKRLRDFKQDHLYTLPDLTENNLRVLERTETEVFDTRQELRNKQERRVYLQAELSALKPHALNYDAVGNRILGAPDRLKSLQAELAGKRARYSASHPDITRLEREIQSLEAEVGGFSSVPDTELANRIEFIRGERAQLVERYSPQHPSVQSLDSELRSLESALRSAQSQSSRVSRTDTPDNPAYIATKAQLEAVILDIAELQSRLSKLSSKFAEYERRVEQAPAVERQYNELDREYQQILAEYEQTRKKGFATKLAGSLEESGNLRGLSVLEPANLPESPKSPNRFVLLVGSFLLATWLALVVAYLREHSDDRIFTADQLEKRMGEGPLATIPDYQPLTGLGRS